MNEMSLAKWMKKTLRRLVVERSVAGRYYEAEGMCRMDTAPPLIVNGAFGGPALVSLGRRYCVSK
jgi:hypothetical protein